MKKVLAIIFVAAVAVGAAWFVPAAATATPALAAVPQGAPLKTIQGMVKANGDNIALVADEDGKSWSIMNPDTLKEHVGHHVEVTAHVYADKKSIHVMSVKMMKKGG